MENLLLHLAVPVAMTTNKDMLFVIVQCIFSCTKRVRCFSDQEINKAQFSKKQIHQRRKTSLEYYTPLKFAVVQLEIGHVHDKQSKIPKVEYFQ